LLQSIAGSSNALEKAIHGEELSFNDGLELINNENVLVLGAAANLIKKKLTDNIITFVASYYLNYTNICAASCPLCAFYRKGTESDSYTLPLEQILTRARIAINEMKATELHIVGGFHPKLGLDYYEKIRDIIVRGKCSGDEWLKTAGIAHEMGIRSNCTMLFGHIEKPQHIIDHLIKVRELQKKTGGFITFIPLKFSLDNTELEQKGLIENESSSIYDLKVIALSRLMLANAMKNISVYWVALGKKLAQVALSYGGNDLVGTAFSEEIFKAAGKITGTTIQELISLIEDAKYIPLQRDTFFNIL
jgi:aminodeoxyfutalosine synthase